MLENNRENVSEIKPFKVEKTESGIYEYRRIKGYQACDFDGTLAG